MKENTAKNLVSWGLTVFIILTVTYGVERLGFLRLLEIEFNPDLNVHVRNWMEGFCTVVTAGSAAACLMLLGYLLGVIQHKIKEKL